MTHDRPLGAENEGPTPADPGTRAPQAGTPPAAGRISPAEKAEPSGTPIQEQRHNADPNAPQHRVVPPGETETPESETGGVPASSLDDEPEPGTDDERRRSQIPLIPPPPDGDEGISIQDNDPNVSR